MLSCRPFPSFVLSKPNINDTLKMTPFEKKSFYPVIRYWLFWALLIGGFLYGVHRYFEYRNMELDKRLERIK